MLDLHPATRLRGKCQILSNSGNQEYLGSFHLRTNAVNTNECIEGCMPIRALRQHGVLDVLRLRAVPAAKKNGNRRGKILA